METINFVVEFPNESIKWLDAHFEDQEPCESTFPYLLRKHFKDMTLEEFLSKNINNEVFLGFGNDCIQSASTLSPQSLR